MARSEAAPRFAADYVSGMPQKGFSRGRFTAENWNDRLLIDIRETIRPADETDDQWHLMWKGKEITDVDLGSLGPNHPIRGTFHANEVASAPGYGTALCGHSEDQWYALVKINKLRKWFYLSWCKNRGQTEALYYAQEQAEGEFALGEPVTYDDANKLAYFLSYIQAVRPAESARLTRIHTHEEEGRTP